MKISRSGAGGNILLESWVLVEQVLMNTFENYLTQQSESNWQEAIETLLPSIHSVDRNAVQIWFRFYPLSLERFLSASENTEEAKRSIAMQGDFGLDDKIDTSHNFLYGHRYWTAVKAALEAESQVFQGESVSLADEITQRALEITAVTALRRAGWMLCAGHDDAARAQLREALRTKRSPAVLERAVIFAGLWLREHLVRRRSAV